jgi:hypothetical protein
VRIKVHRKDYDWSVGLIYDPRGLPGVTTVMSGVAGCYKWYQSRPSRFHGRVRVSDVGTYA